MRHESFRVVRVVGRYPRRATFCAESIRVSIAQDDDRLYIRVDDDAAPDFWLEIDLATTNHDRADREP